MNSFSISTMYKTTQEYYLSFRGSILTCIYKNKKRGYFIKHFGTSCITAGAHRYRLSTTSHLGRHTCRTCSKWVLSGKRPDRTPSRQISLHTLLVTETSPKPFSRFCSRIHALCSLLKGDLRPPGI